MSFRGIILAAGDSGADPATALATEIPWPKIALGASPLRGAATSTSMYSASVGSVSPGCTGSCVTPSSSAVCSSVREASVVPYHS